MKKIIFNTQNFVVLMIVLIDQFAKNYIDNYRPAETIIPGFLDISYVQNKGAVFGLAQGSVDFLVIVSFVICLAIFSYLTIQNMNNKNTRVGLWLILGGGIGNLIDRIARGYVVDFITTPFIATFNIADACITIGIILLIASELFSNTSNRKSLY